jgi:hypothetical protein
MFVLHASTGASRWCWLFASALRYAAVYHPLWHRRQWRLGHRTLPVIFFISAIVNVFLLFTVESNHLYCSEQPLSPENQVNRWLHLIEMTWSYLMPVCITAALDVRVLFFQPPRLSDVMQNHQNSSEDGILTSSTSFNGDSMIISPQESVNKPLCNDNHLPRNQSHMAVSIWLAITSLNLLLNAPDVAMRFAILCDMQLSHSFLFNPLFAISARFMYFVQFCINAGYLSTVVFRGSTNSHGSNRKSKKWARFSAFIASGRTGIIHTNSSEVPLYTLNILEPWSDFEGYQM